MTEEGVIAEFNRRPHEEQLVALLRKALKTAKIVFDRFSDQNGQVDEKVWNENFPAKKALRDMYSEIGAEIGEEKEVDHGS